MAFISIHIHNNLAFTSHRSVQRQYYLSKLISTSHCAQRVRTLLVTSTVVCDKLLSPVLRNLVSFPAAHRALVKTQSLQFTNLVTLFSFLSMVVLNTDGYAVRFRDMHVCLSIFWSAFYHFNSNFGCLVFRSENAAIKLWIPDILQHMTYNNASHSCVVGDGVGDKYQCQTSPCSLLSS